MPLLIPLTTGETPGGGGGGAPPPFQNTVVRYSWISPSGEVLDMSTRQGRQGVMVLAGVAGIGMAPREVNRVDRHRGGTFGRRTWVDERIITLPLSIRSPGEGQKLIDLRRHVASLFAETVIPGHPPNPGKLRIERADGSWRETNAIYYDGLQIENENEHGPELTKPVLQLLSMDPWFYEDTDMSIEFVLPTSRNFYNPFLTVSSDHIMGERRIEIRSDVPVSPVWILQGPADSVIASLPEENLQWVFGPVLENETITIDTDNSTISNQDDENRIDGLDWPQSSFFELPPGNILLNVNMSGVGSSTGPPAGVRLTYKPRREMA